MSALVRKEDCRHAVLAFLAERPSLRHGLGAIRRGVNREGGNYAEQEIAEAAEFEVGLGNASATTDAHGVSRYYQATSAGILNYERGGV